MTYGYSEYFGGNSPKPGRIIFAQRNYDMKRGHRYHQPAEKERESGERKKRERGRKEEREKGRGEEKRRGARYATSEASLLPVS